MLPWAWVNIVVARRIASVLAPDFRDPMRAGPSIERPADPPNSAPLR